jgi:hypothetical protein
MSDALFLAFDRDGQPQNMHSFSIATAFEAATFVTLPLCEKRGEYGAGRN